MNALVRPHVSLTDKYDRDEGAVFLTGVQALVRLPMARRRLDRVAGLNTAGFISGYRGSPLGTYDTQLAAARERLRAHDIVVKPAVNEDLGATAVWGTQHVNLFPGARFDGVFGIWYGKGPGVDRCGDAFKHANMAGTSKNGGVLALAGDDHGCKSSTLPNQSEYAFIDAEMPILNPCDVGELLTFGVKAIALSRYAGLWVGMKTIADVVDSSATVFLDPTSCATVEPQDFLLPEDGLNIRLGATPLEMEHRHRNLRLPAAQAFARANGLDRIEIEPVTPRLGVMATGKAYLDVVQAMSDLGIDRREAERLGLRLYKVGLAWPLEPVGARRFADGLEQVLVVEERRDVLECQLKTLTHDLPDGRRPRIVGKFDEQARPLLPNTADLDAARVALALLSRIPEADWSPRMAARRSEILAARAANEPVLHSRKPFFCPGCPHNLSTKTPEDGRAMAGIGCHFLVQWMPRRSEVCTHMGAEGVTWMGQSPFTDEAHVFANLGDGTYFHSGLLAIRQSVAAGVNITYKILYNDVVAMTGGQEPDGPLTVPTVARQLDAEGVGKIVVVADDPERHRGDPLMPDRVSFEPRERLDVVQEALRLEPGVTAIIYDQACATETRRRRKRGLEPDPDVRVFINTATCEDCGDCSAQSNCIAIEPTDGDFAPARKIDQSACNKDQSCVRGFCPSFVRVKGARPRKVTTGDIDALVGGLPDPVVPSLTSQPWNLVLAGVGGMGVTALAQIIGMAAHLEGGCAKVVDMLGMAQKGGGVFSNVRIAASDAALTGPKISATTADLVIAADMVVAHGPVVASTLSRERSTVLLNTTLQSTAEFVENTHVVYRKADMRERLRRHAHVLREFEAGRFAARLLGDAIYTNVMLLGAAWQLGLLPLSSAALHRAIELNGTAVEQNKRAFGLGRLAAHDPAALAGAAGGEPAVAETLDGLIARRMADLTTFQNAAYAALYAHAVDRVREAETSLDDSDFPVTRAVGLTLYRVMAYKDEYEVARLYTDGRFERDLKAAFDGDLKVEVELAPPFLNGNSPPQKRAFGPWIFPVLRLLARMKVLRGTYFDPFGYTAERRQERALVHQTLADAEFIAGRLNSATRAQLLDLAQTAGKVRGYGHVKAEAFARYTETRADVLANLAAPPKESRDEIDAPATRRALTA